jgi:uncharacterized protein YdaU (DUF1376 family)
MSDFQDTRSTGLMAPTEASSVSSTRADIWMPLYIGDYLADTSRLTTEQHGAYFLLIMDYWRQGPPPNNPQVLAQITRMTLDAWSNAQALLLDFFQMGDDGRLHHKRIDRELAKAVENKKTMTRRATKAAQARWGTDGGATSIPKAKHEECPSPSPSPSPSPQVPLKQVGDVLFGIPPGTPKRGGRNV